MWGDGSPPSPPPIFLYKEYTMNKGLGTYTDAFKRRKKKFEGTYKGAYWRYYANARNNKPPLEFKLTQEDFKNIVGRMCFYCGDTLVQAGFDRLDNAKGYVPENVVPCCSACNYMRRTQTQQAFMQRCEKIVGINRDVPIHDC